MAKCAACNGLGFQSVPSDYSYTGFTTGTCHVCKGTGKAKINVITALTSSKAMTQKTKLASAV